MDTVLTAPALAAATAPVIDRLRLGISQRASTRVPEIATRFGIPQQSLVMAPYLRNVYPDRSVRRDGLVGVYTYAGPHKAEAGLAALSEAGLVFDSDGALSLTESGRELLGAIIEVTTEVVEQAWSEHRQTVLEVLPLAERALAAAWEDGGRTFEAMAPLPTRGSWFSDCGRLSEILTALRFHRFDAHIASWQSRGLTVEQMTAMPHGVERSEIEHDTNVAAAAPYEALDANERLAMLAALGALPN